MRGMESDIGIDEEEGLVGRTGVKKEVELDRRDDRALGHTEVRKYR